MLYFIIGSLLFSETLTISLAKEYSVTSSHTRLCCCRNCNLMNELEWTEFTENTKLNSSKSHYGVQQ